MNEIRELTEMDLKAVSGGGLIDLPSITTVVQTNVGVAPTLAIGVGGGSATAVGQLDLKNILSGHKL